MAPERVRDKTANPPSPELTHCTSPPQPVSINLAETCDVQNCYHRTVIEPLVPVVICQLCDDAGHCARNCTYTLAQSSYRFTCRLGSVPEARPVPSTNTEASLPTPISTVKTCDRIDCFF